MQICEGGDKKGRQGSVAEENKRSLML